jgi:N4-gp56 family major capsid protein
MGEIMDYGSISQRTAGYAAAEMLRHAEPYLVLSKMGMTKPMPKNKAEKVVFRRPVPLAPALQPVTEGVTPTAQKFSYVDIETSLKQYGRPIQITDKVMDFSEDPVLQTATLLAGEQAGMTIEQVLYGILKAGTNVVYANGASRSAVNTPISLNKQRAVTRVLAAQKARMITRMLSAGPGYGTSAIEAGWVAVGHTDLDSDIRNLAGFIPVSKYANGSAISEHEIGSVERVRYILTPDLAPFADAGGAKGSMVSTSGTSADVYPILYLGQDAFAQVPLKGQEAMTPYVINAKPTDSDPLAQRNYVAWKTWYSAVILNDMWMCRLEVAVTAL